MALLKFKTKFTFNAVFFKLMIGGPADVPRSIVAEVPWNKVADVPKSRVAHVP